jgi:hypothetical protein
VVAWLDSENHARVQHHFVTPGKSRGRLISHGGRMSPGPGGLPGDLNRKCNVSSSHKISVSVHFVASIPDFLKPATVTIDRTGIIIRYWT